MSGEQCGADTVQANSQCGHRHFGLGNKMAGLGARVQLVVRQFEALSVTDDGPLAANRAKPGEQFQRDLGHPGSVLFSGSGSAIKRITAVVKTGPDRRCQVSIW